MPKNFRPDLSFIKNKEYWGTYFQGSIKTIPEEDFRLVESEMKKIISERPDEKLPKQTIKEVSSKTEDDYEQLIKALPLQSNSLHDRLGEMLESIGSWMDYNAQTRHKITSDHAYELDVAWLSGKNPEVAVEIQISGNLTEAKDRLAQARKFNYRKVIMVLREQDLKRFNLLMRHEPDLRSWMEAWSIGAVYEMYKSGEKFFWYFRKLKEAVYKDKKGTRVNLTGQNGLNIMEKYGLPPQTSLDAVKIRISSSYKNPNVGKIHQVVLKDGPRTFRIATLLEIIDPKTTELHHYSLKIDSIDRLKSGWFSARKINTFGRR